MSSYYGRGVQGATGPAGRAATITVGTVTTGAPTDPASVVNVGDASQAVFDFVIPQGQQGVQGETGLAATVDVDPNTITGQPTDPASVVNTGDTHNAVFKFTIPKGDKGDPGAAAEITVGNVTTVPPSGGVLGQATVTERGTAQSRIFDFGIPAGLKGDTGSQGAPGFPGALSGAGAPTSAVGDMIGQLYLDTTTGEVYKMTARNPNTWTLLIPAVDSTVTPASSNLITSGGVAAALAGYPCASQRVLTMNVPAATPYTTPVLRVTRDCVLRVEQFFKNNDSTPTTLEIINGIYQVRNGNTIGGDWLASATAPYSRVVRSYSSWNFPVKAGDVFHTGIWAAEAVTGTLVMRVIPLGPVSVFDGLPVAENAS